MFAVLKNNPQFRRLWSAQVVSAIGDWLNRIATLVLIGELGAGGVQIGVGFMYAVEYTLRLLPTSAFSPLAGPLADRFSRRAIMVTSDLARAAVVLCLLFIREPGHLRYLYVLIFLQVSLGIFFDSARSGALPNTVAKKDLHSAYSLSAATWSTMLALGGFLGGVLVKYIGTGGVFIADAITYLISASFLLKLRLPPVPKHPQPFHVLDVLLLRDLRRGFAHARQLGIARILFSKVLWGPCGGYVILFPLIAMRFDQEGTGLREAGTAIGLMFAARGIGTGLGPVLARRFLGSSEDALIRQAWGGMFLGSLGYVLLPLAGSLPVAMACVTIAHIGGSAQWVGSTTYWQIRIDDAFRGRVFATEFLMMTLSFAVFSLASGLMYDITQDLDLVIWSLVGLTTIGACVAQQLFKRLPRTSRPPAQAESLTSA